jgi:hypothetical protein
MRLLVDITAHGWGHLSQTAPIIQSFQQLCPDLEVVVRSAIDTSVITRRLTGVIRHYASDTDFGLAMKSPYEVDRSATLRRYQALHERFDENVGRVAQIIHAERCDAVFSNVGYVAIAAAHRAGVRAIACSSLNWVDMFEAYCGELPGGEEILAEIQSAYRMADMFIRLAPGMPMGRFDTHQIEQPIANIGGNRRHELTNAVGVPDTSTIILCAFGGMLPAEPLPFVLQPEGLTILGPSAWARYGVIPVDQLPLPYADILASVDGVVAKPGYGIVAELGCTATPAIMVSRGDWPEEPYLLDWLSNHGRHRSVDHQSRLSAEAVKLLLEQCVDTPYRSIRSGGEQDVARALWGILDR